MTTLPSDELGRIAAHWRDRGDLAFIRGDLQRRGLAPPGVTVEDLAPYDQLHAGQLAATRRFAAWAAVPAGARVLDAGAGLGGAARWLARTRGARVWALEGAPELHAAGQELTAWLDLSAQVTHLLGDARAAAPVAAVDRVWIQHVDMHVPDKPALYRALAAWLAPGGRVVWHDWLAGSAGPPHYPVPWSTAGEISHLASEAELRAALATAGLTLLRLDPSPDGTRADFVDTRDRARRALAAGGPPARQARLERVATEADDVIRSLDEGRLVSFLGEAG
jgi:SAM-dependent methyltransferase